ncbi:MAG: hypothetical protein ACOYON_14595 [Fimbriimonas sp.]
MAKQVGAESARWAFAQWEMRRAGRIKFSRAEEMLFVREALEQSTSEAVALWRARRFPTGECVADLTCGIGGDLMALAATGHPVLGYEIDPERARYATHNLGLITPNGEIREQDCLGTTWDFEFAFADPARRVDGRRTLDPESFQPDPSSLTHRMAKLRLGAIKLSPMLPDAFLESLGPRLEFVSYGRECREACIWMGREVGEPGRLAVHVESGDTLLAGYAAIPIESPQSFLYDADPAAVRAHALGTLCELHDLSALGDSYSYLTGDNLVSSPWLRAYRVISSVKADLKAARAARRELDATVFEVKVSGPKIDGSALRKQLTTEGKRPVSLCVWSLGKSIRWTFVEAV